MADSPILPGDRAWKDASGRPLPVEFYRFLRDLVRYIALIDGNTVELADIEARLSALEESGGANILGPMSVRVLGSSSGFTLQLFGDQLSPGPLFSYSTDAAGQKGWYERLLATLADVDFSTPPGVDDVLKFDGTSWVPGQAAAAQLFNYITTDGEPYCTEDYADLYTGVI